MSLGSHFVGMGDTGNMPTWLFCSDGRTQAEYFLEFASCSQTFTVSRTMEVSDESLL